MTTARREMERIGKNLSRLQVWLWLLPGLFLGYFFFYPLAAILQEVVKAFGESGQAPDFSRQIWPALSFTLWQALLSMLLTMLVGLPGAYLFARFNFPGKKLLRALTTLPFILPTVVVAAGFNALLGPRGWINLLLMGVFGLSEAPIQAMNTLGIILLAHVFYNITVVIRVVGSAWAGLDIRLEQAGRMLGASPLRAWWEVTLPLIRPAVLGAALLVFLFDFMSFGVVLMLGGPGYSTLEVEIYYAALQMLDLPLAGLLSAIQIGVTLAVGWLINRAGQGAVPLMPRLKGEGMRRPRHFSEKVFVWVMVSLLGLMLLLPLVGLVMRSFSSLEAVRGQREEVVPSLTLDYYRELFINRRASFFYIPPVEAVKNSVGYGLATVVISVGLGYLAALGLQKRGRLARVMESLLLLPLGTSAVTLGLGYILVFNRPPVDVRSFPALIPIAHSLVALPFVIRTLAPALASIPSSLRQVAATLGAPPWRVWLEVDLPVTARAVMVSAVFAFAISLGEFGATTFLARPENPTIPLAIFRFISQPGALNYGQAMAMATILMVICTASLLVMDRLEGKGS